MAQRPRKGPRVPFGHSLQTKFMLSYGAIILALVLFLNTYPILISQNMVFQSKQDSLWRQADIITSTLAGRESLTAEGVEATLSLLSVTGVDRLMVTGPDGLVLYDTSEVDNARGKYALLWEVVSALEGNDVFQSEYRDRAFRSRAAAPIVYRGMTLGAVSLYEYDGEQAELLLDFQTNLLRISAVVCVAALLFSVALSKAITRRVGILLRGIRTVREGEYSYRVSMSGADELSRLADEFNELTGRLQTTEEVRRRFVSDASHELKTPLASIRLLTDSILQADHMDSETAGDSPPDVGAGPARPPPTTKTLPPPTRVAPAPAAAAVPVDVGAVVERVEHMLTPLARAVEVELELRLQPGCLIAATEDELYQIAFNLMENAVKYNLPGGKVYVTLQGDARQVRLRVEDTGVGIPEEDLPKIFDRFYRVDKARSRESGGTGLGLSIVWDTVRRYGGTVTARRREPEGTCFEVVFPRLAEKGGTQR